jgi:putative transposase
MLLPRCRRKHPMTYNPAKHHRRSIRLKAYDYSSLGYYFITLCIHDRWIRMFGDVDNGKMVLNDCGIIANEWIGKLSGQYGDVLVDSYVIMPNHVHLILHIVAESVGSVGAIHELPHPVDPVSPVGVIHELPLQYDDINIQHNELPPRNQHQLPQQETDNVSYRKNRRVMTIPKIIGYYRMNTGKHINAICKTSGNPVWQRNYWEHIIRNENEHIRISQYIIENSLNWDLDQLNGGGGNRVLEPAMPYGEESWII